MRLRDVPNKSRAAIHLVRRRLLAAAVAPLTASRLDQIERFEHPLAAQIARTVARMRSADASSAPPLVARIEKQRAALLGERRSLSEYTGVGDEALVVGEACRASRRPRDALALYLLVDSFKPKRILELGTNVGISSAYMAAAQQATDGTVTSLEGSKGRAAVAKRVHAALGLMNVEYVPGNFEDTLDSTLDRLGCSVDFAFIDGHHEYAPTLHYFDRIWNHSTEHAVFVFDDIRWSFGMVRAWRMLQKDPRLELVIDLCGMGLAVSTRQPHHSARLVSPVLA
jgi:predicted O-methyltransferase YrrM